jgi:hypothetical protein
MSLYRITVAIAKPCCSWKQITVRNTLGTFEKIIGGGVSELRLADGHVILYDRNAEAKGKAYNRTIVGRKIYGTFLVVKAGENRWLSVDDDLTLWCSCSVRLNNQQKGEA